MTDEEALERTFDMVREAIEVVQAEVTDNLTLIGKTIETLERMHASNGLLEARVAMLESERSG
ncbi:MAG: hypothetical protein IIB33_00385 [Chloroflexi bacterium]|nr:hypothetical protein [Chloroflexota bacterium]